MTTPSADALGDVNASSLKLAIPEPLAKDTPYYLVEYGARLDDGAFVFHFFPQTTGWPPQAGDAFKAAIDAAFDVAKVSAEYVPELDSFCVVVGELALSLDPWPTVQSFFDALDASFRSDEA